MGSFFLLRCGFRRRIRAAFAVQPASVRPEPLSRESPYLFLDHVRVELGDGADVGLHVAGGPVIRHLCTVEGEMEIVVVAD